jgi:hypothetical protein
MSGMVCNEEHPSREAQPASTDYAGYSSTSTVRRSGKRTASSEPASAVKDDCQYNALVRGDIAPHELRAAVGLY